jgi:hypothetical protein
MWHQRLTKSDQQTFLDLVELRSKPLFSATSTRFSSTRDSPAGAVQCAIFIEAIFWRAGCLLVIFTALLLVDA